MAKKLPKTDKKTAEKQIEDINKQIEEGEKRFTEAIAKKWRDEAKKCKLDDGSLMKFLEKLASFNHGYSSIAYAMACAASAAAWAIEHSPQGGMTGFQWGHGSLMALRLLNYENNELGFRVQDFDNLLYPQYSHHFTGIDITRKLADKLSETARKNLESRDTPVHENVKAWWTRLANGDFPEWIHIKD